MFHFPPPIGFFTLGTKVGVVLFVGQYGLKVVIGQHYFSVLKKIFFIYFEKAVLKYHTVSPI